MKRGIAVGVAALGMSAGIAQAGDDLDILYEAIYDSGTDFEYASDAAVDGDGNVFVLAYAYNPFPTFGDAYVAKLSPAGEVLFTVEFNGSDLDVLGGIDVDANGDVYVAGRTLSHDLPMVNAIQPSLNGPSDGYLAKLSGEDGSILFATYIGGARGDALSDVAIGPNGEVVVAGHSDSIDFPMVNPVQDQLTLIDCFCDDVVAMRLTPDGQSITFSTYLGGRSRDQARQVGVDDEGRIVISGITRSPDWPVMEAFQPTFGGGLEDVIVARMDPDAASLEYSTYLGGETVERSTGLAVTGDGRAYLGGVTQSVDFPTTPGAFQEFFVGGIDECGSPPFVPLQNCPDGFVTALDPSGGMMFGTFLAGGDDDQLSALDVAADGRVRVTGHTISEDFPDDPSGPLMTRAYVSELSADGSELNYTMEIDTNTPGDSHALAIGPDGATHFGGAIGFVDGNFVSRDVYVVGLDTATGCLADFNGDGSLDVLDFVAFQDAFLSGDDSADCDGNGELSVLDFVCFQSAFQAGCA